MTDVCVIGGGPAGAALALRLAQLGHGCVVLARHFAGRGESLAPTAWPLLEALGVRGRLENAAFLPTSRTLAAWGHSAEWSPAFAAPAVQVDRDLFDGILLDAAETAGARVLRCARAIRAERRPSGWRIEVRSPAGDEAIESRILADAAGRVGWLRGQKARLAPRTLALYARWSDVPLDGPETRVEAGDHEWLWGAPLTGNRFNTAVFVEPGVCREALRTPSGLRDLHDRVVSRSTLLSPCLRGNPIGGIGVFDATPLCDDEPATADTIKIGEASVAIDPLSSQGVPSALGSALHAAAVLHTALERPADTALAIEFYRRAQAAAASFHARVSRRVYREVAASRPTPFWLARAGPPALSERSITRVEGGAREFGSSPALPAPSEVSVSRVEGSERGTRVEGDEPNVLTPSTLVRPGDGLQAIAAPVLRGDFVVAGSQLVVPGLDQPVSFVAGIEVAQLFAMVHAPLAVRDLTTLWSRHVPPDRAAAVVHWAWEHGALAADR